MNKVVAAVKTFFQMASTKVTAYVGAAVIFLPELQQYLPQVIPYLPQDKVGVWITNNGPRILGAAVIFFRVRRDFVATLKTGAPSAP